MSYIDDALRGYQKLLIIAFFIVAMPILLPIYWLLKPVTDYYDSWHEPTVEDVLVMASAAKNIKFDLSTQWGDVYGEPLTLGLTHADLANPRYRVWGKAVVGDWGIGEKIDHAFVAEVTYHHQYPDDQEKRARHLSASVDDANGHSVDRTRSPTCYTFDSYKIIPIDDSDPRWEAKLGLPVKHGAHKPGSPQEWEAQEKRNDAEWQQSQYK